MVLTISQLVVVLHLWLLLTDLNHAVQISDFHGKARLILLFIQQAFMLIDTFAPSATFNRVVFTLVDLSVVDRLSHPERLKLVSRLIKGLIR